MIYINSLFETYTEYNKEQKDWSGRHGHTEGTLNGIKPKTSFDSINDFNKRIESVGLPPLNAKALKNGKHWTKGEDEGSYELNFRGDSDATPNPRGKYNYDVYVSISEIEKKPLVIQDKKEKINFKKFVYQGSESTFIGVLHKDGETIEKYISLKKNDVLNASISSRKKIEKDKYGDIILNDGYIMKDVLLDLFKPNKTKK